MCVGGWVAGIRDQLQNLLLPDLTPKLNDRLDMVGWKDRHRYRSWTELCYDNMKLVITADKINIKIKHATFRGIDQ